MVNRPTDLAAFGRRQAWPPGTAGQHCECVPGPGRCSGGLGRSLADPFSQRNRQRRSSSVRASLVAGRRAAVCRAARAPTSPMPPGVIMALNRCLVRSNGSALRLAAFCLAGGPPGYGGDCGVSLVQRLRCPGGRITALGGQRQAMHERPGQRQGDSEQQPYPQAPGEKCPHVQDPFVVLREVLWRYPPCPGLTSSRAALPLRSHMVTRVGEVPHGRGRGSRAGCPGWAERRFR